MLVYANASSSGSTAVRTDDFRETGGEASGEFGVAEMRLYSSPTLLMLTETGVVKWPTRRLPLPSSTHPSTHPPGHKNWFFSVSSISASLHVEAASGWVDFKAPFEDEKATMMVLRLLLLRSSLRRTRACVCVRVCLRPVRSARHESEGGRD